jgi:hypothetical protein
LHHTGGGRLQSQIGLFVCLVLRLVRGEIGGVSLDWPS